MDWMLDDHTALLGLFEEYESGMATKWSMNEYRDSFCDISRRTRGKLQVHMFHEIKVE